MYHNNKFILKSNFTPKGDQANAILKLVKGINKNKIQTLIGITGSGKTFTIANVINKIAKNTLIISHNKTLASQLYSEFQQFFPKNNVGYFVSYYDYYQPESYIPQTDTYIEKNTKINEKIEKMRLDATTMLLSKEPSIIISTVSCIYSLGSPKEWENMSIKLYINQSISITEIIKKLIVAKYKRNQIELKSGTFRVRGDIIEIMPSYNNDIIRISLFDDKIEKIVNIDNMNLIVKKNHNIIIIYPAKHYLFSDKTIDKAINSIQYELKNRLKYLKDIEKQRLETRTKYDLETIKELGYCAGIENYSRHFDDRKPGEKAFCLLDFFENDYLLIIDESHVTIPQLRGMYKGDHSRKKKLIDNGFRLPSAYDNRPLKFNEFERYMKNTIFISATPSEYEFKNSTNNVEQIIRPTGLLDPQVIIKPTKNQMVSIVQKIKKTINKKQRILITTLTKRMAEDLSEYLSKKSIKVMYLHSEIDNLKRIEIIRQLRLGKIDVIVGINLLREGLDIPEVSLVIILDADKEGFLRNTTSLIQTFGRAARNKDGEVIMYADKITESIKNAIKETQRRRMKQINYNKKNNIIPQTIKKPIINIMDNKTKTQQLVKNKTIDLEIEMKKASDDLNFEKAIELRNMLLAIKNDVNKNA